MNAAVYGMDRIALQGFLGIGLEAGLHCKYFVTQRAENIPTP